MWSMDMLEASHKPLTKCYTSLLLYTLRLIFWCWLYFVFPIAFFIFYLYFVFPLCIFYFWSATCSSSCIPKRNIYVRSGFGQVMLGNKQEKFFLQIVEAWKHKLSEKSEKEWWYKPLEYVECDKEKDKCQRKFFLSDFYSIIHGCNGYQKAMSEEIQYRKTISHTLVLHDPLSHGHILPPRETSPVENRGAVATPKKSQCFREESFCKMFHKMFAEIRAKR